VILLGRRRDIARGVTNLPLEKVVKLRARWEAEGYVLPPLERSEEEIRGLGDLIAKGLSYVGIKADKGCGCDRRREKLNRWVPFRKRVQKDDVVLSSDDG
jgi:hypothetical protein